MVASLWHCAGTVSLLVVLVSVTTCEPEALQRQTRTIIDVGTKPWPNGIIYYEFASDFGRGLASSKSKVLQAMTEWSRLTCIKFQATTSSAYGKVIIRNGPGGCNANQGFPGNNRVFYINLEYPGCVNYRVALHELGHMIGLAHEHQNPERTNLQIHWNKIQPDFVRWFYAKHPDSVEDFGVGYDPLSVMHYNKEGFAIIPGDRTMTYSDPTIDAQMGKVPQLSLTSDVPIVKKFYNCDGDNADLTKVLNNGRACFDNFVDCNSWSARGDCQSKASFMRVSCRKSCNICRPTGTSTSTSSSCKDGNSNCGYWTSTGQCNKNFAYMSRYCQKSCGFCSATVLTTPKPTTPKPPANCNDYNSNCGYWSSTNQCTLNYPYMSKYCQKSCSLCTTIAPTTPKPSIVCADEHTSCSAWASRGECTANPNYMLLKCKASCNICSSTCVDSSGYCLSYATSGYCVSVPTYMGTYCRKTCRLC